MSQLYLGIFWTLVHSPFPEYSVLVEPQGMVVVERHTVKPTDHGSLEPDQSLGR